MSEKINQVDNGVNVPGALDLWEMRKQGLLPSTIAKELRSRGFATARGKSFNSWHIMNLLRRSRDEGLISKEEWAKVVTSKMSARQMGRTAVLPAGILARARTAAKGRRSSRQPTAPSKLFGSDTTIEAIAELVMETKSIPVKDRLEILGILGRSA